MRIDEILNKKLVADIIVEETNNEEALELLKLVLSNSNLADAKPRIKQAINITDNKDVKDILGLTLSNSNLADVKPRINQAIKLLSGIT